MCYCLCPFTPTPHLSAHSQRCMTFSVNRPLSSSFRKPENVALLLHTHSSLGNNSRQAKNDLETATAESHCSFPP